VHSVTGESVIWALGALPIFAGLNILDFVWGAYICARRKWQSGYMWLATFIAWVIAIWIDFAHRLSQELGGGPASAIQADVRRQR